jgi:phospholipid/cholesterol/gamma-HCH transport system substrate-binding protein
MTSDRSAVVIGDLSLITKDIRDGKSLVGALITDTLLSGQIKQSVVNIKMVSDKVAIISGDLSVLTQQARSGEGTVGTLMMDTTFVGNLNQSVLNLKSGTANFNDNMEALKHSWLLRGYFRKQEKKQAPK